MPASVITIRNYIRIPVKRLSVEVSAGQYIEHVIGRNFGLKPSDGVAILTRRHRCDNIIECNVCCIFDPSNEVYEVWV